VRGAFAVLAASTVFAGCSHAFARSDGAPLAVSPAAPPNQLVHMVYIGRWQFVSHRRDGRFRGASVRSFRPGDSLAVVFTGTRLRLFGITGSNGGVATIVLSPNEPQTVSFVSAHKITHRMLYDSGPLPAGLHSAGIVVSPANSKSARGYVNIDELEVSTM
jgi:hypothetical protein